MNPFKVVQASDDQAHALTKILSNKTAQRILESLEKEQKTESELAKELSLPISTIHYNMKQLVKAELVKNDIYSYSKKGREIIHYSLSDQHIVIRTKPSLSIALLQQIIPAFFIFLLGLFIFEDVFSFMSSNEQMTQIQSTPETMMINEVAAEDVDVDTQSRILSRSLDDEEKATYELQRNKKLLLFSFLSALILVFSIILTSVMYKFNQNKS